VGWCESRNVLKLLQPDFPIKLEPVFGSGFVKRTMQRSPRGNTKA
jgi:hypothetical protein